MSTELVLVLSDILVPLKYPNIDKQFKSILLPNKINHLLCLGNIGNQDVYYWLEGLSPNFDIVKGDFDIYQNYPEKKVIQIGAFKIGMIHGHQLIPPDDLETLSNIQRELDCDVLISGYTYKYGINIYENKLYLNPGSISGGLSPLMEECIPSFMLLAITGEEMVIYSYVLSDKNEKFEVGQVDYMKGSNEIKVVKSIKIEEDEDEKINDEKEKEPNNDINNKNNNEENYKEEKEKSNEEKQIEENNNINNENENENINKEEVIYENKPPTQRENSENNEEESQNINNNKYKEDKIDE